MVELQRIVTLVQRGQHRAAREAIDGARERRDPAWSYLSGCALELAALEQPDRDERMRLLQRAARAHEAASGGAQTIVTGASSWGPAVRLATIALIVGRVDAALEAFDETIASVPTHDEPRLGRIECLLRLGRAREALLELHDATAPCGALLGARPDGWTLAAHAAEMAGLIGQAGALLAGADRCLAAGFVAPHRRELYDDLNAALGVAGAGRGPVARLAALMVGRAAPLPLTASRDLDRAMAERMIQRALLDGHAERLVPLLDAPAERVVPGIGDLVQRAIVGLARGSVSCV